MFIASSPHAHLGRVVDTGECVRYVQVAAQASHTSRWVRGEKVRGAHHLPVGTTIATFDAQGRYANDTTGRSHAAIYIGQNDQGLRVLDQWAGQPVHERLIRFRDGKAQPVNDGDAYFTVEDA
jgi:hypothetical protein